MLERFRKLGYSPAFAVLFCALGSRAQVLTSQYDNARSGANLKERVLTPRNVNARQFGKVFTLHVDGDVYAQPLFLPGVLVPGKGRHDLLFVATEHDSVYAFDAYGKPSAPLWQVSLLTNDRTPVSADDASCPFIQPEIGITSTPVIDAKTGTLYVLARTKERGSIFSTSEFHQQLHALAVTTGAEKFGGPVEIRAAMRSKGDGSSGGNLQFEPLRENPRASLLQVNDMLYLSWASACDVGPYHGWVMAYDARTLQRTAIYNASPDGDDSGVWAGDSGPAADKNGDVFVATGNGAFDGAQGGRDFGDSFLKLHLSGPTLNRADYFTPFNADYLNAHDLDLGSGGPVLLPDQAGPHPHLALIAGKDPTLYLIDRDHMGGYRPNDNSQAVQTVDIGGGVYGSMAYWNQNVYVMASGDVLRDFSLENGRLSLKNAGTFKLPAISATPIVSANGAKDGVVWVLITKGWNSPDRTEILYAFDAGNVAHELYDSEQKGARDRAGYALRFNIPTVVNGRVYVGAKREIDVYGLLPAAAK